MCSGWAKWSRVLCSKIRGSRTRSHDGLECQILNMCSRGGGGSDQNLRMSEDGGASSLEESKCLAGIFQQIVNDCKVSFFSFFLRDFLTKWFCFASYLFSTKMSLAHWVQQKLFYAYPRLPQSCHSCHLSFVLALN